MNQRQIEPASQAGLAARSTAIAVLAQVLDRHIPLDDAFATAVTENLPGKTASRDRAFARALVTTALRRLGQIDDALSRFMEKPLPRKAGPTRHILRLGLAEILFLDTKPHATVHCAVALAAQDGMARHYKALVNAVLRRATQTKTEIVAPQDAPRLNTPDWLWDGWCTAYDQAIVRAIAQVHLTEPYLDLTVADPNKRQEWADKLEAVILPTGTLRRRLGGLVDELPGFAEGAWWVQDAAAALPATFLGDVRHRTIIDLCAAPGGKTAQLAAAGAHVIAIDRSKARHAVMRQNIDRLGLEVQLILDDAATWQAPELASHVLLDAPCTATGTIRRHPDLPYLKKPQDVAALAQQQKRLLGHAAALLAPGGLLVFCTCSLDPAEGPDIITTFLDQHKAYERLPLAPQDVSGCAEFITRDGDLRTLPCHWPDSGGLDGFYAARLVRTH